MSLLTRSICGILGILTAVTAVGSTLPPAVTRVACVGDAGRIGTYPTDLKKLLGRGFEVKPFVTSGESLFSNPSGGQAVQAALAYRPDVVLLQLNDAVEHLTDQQLNAFEPALRHLLARFARANVDSKVYLWPSARGTDPTSLYSSTIYPLELQAAREAGATVLTRDEGDGAESAADFVAEALAPQTLKARWRIVRADSFQADEGEPKHAIDGDPDTYWHTEYDPMVAPYPHFIVIDLGSQQWIKGLRYLPRQDGGVNGTVKNYEVFVGDSPDSQTTLVAKGSFRNGQSQKSARFRESVRTRYVRLVCLSEQSGGPWASAAEIDVIRDPAK